MAKDAPEKTSAALEPDNIPPEVALLPTLQNTAVMGLLTPKRQTMLVAIALNLMSENIQSDRSLAKEIGVHRTSLSNARLDPAFNAALVSVMRDVIRGRADEPVANLFRLAEKDVKANEILLRINEVYQPTSRNLNVNANISQQAEPVTQEDILDRHLMKYMSIGYDLQRYHDEVDARWRTLQEEGV